MEKVENWQKDKKFHISKKIWQIIIGVLTGFINGLFGGGGGMILVPMLNRILGLNQKQSHATAILIILPLSIVSCIVYLIFGNIKWNLVLPVTIGVIGGGVLGAFLLKKISNQALSFFFYVLMIIAGIKMIF